MRCKSCNNQIDYEIRNTLTGHRHDNSGKYEDLCRGCLRISKQAAYSNYHDTVDNEDKLGASYTHQDTEAVYQGFSDTGWVNEN